MRELPGYRQAAKPGYAPLKPGDIDAYRKRMEATWEPDDSPKQVYMVFFVGGFAEFCETVSCARTIAPEVSECSFEGPGGRSHMTVSCTHEQLERLKLAVKGCGVTGTAVRMVHGRSVV